MSGREKGGSSDFLRRHQGWEKTIAPGRPPKNPPIKAPNHNRGHPATIRTCCFISFTGQPAASQQPPVVSPKRLSHHTVFGDPQQLIPVANYKENKEAGEQRRDSRPISGQRPDRNAQRCRRQCNTIWFGFDRLNVSAL